MPVTGSFACGNADVDQLVKNSVWSQKGNFCDIPTDCPTRERAGWTGDMGVFIETGLTLMDCYPVVEKWLAECREPVPGWTHGEHCAAHQPPRLHDPHALYVGGLGRCRHSGALRPL